MASNFEKDWNGTWISNWYGHVKNEKNGKQWLKKTKNGKKMVKMKWEVKYIMKSVDKQQQIINLWVNTIKTKNDRI